MRYINPSNLPRPLFDAIARDDHVSLGSDIGASGIPAPPRQVALLHQYRDGDAITIDVRSRFFALLGQAVHVILERAAKADGITVFAEERAEILVEGWRVAARLDHLAYDATRTLTDYKVTSVFAVKNWQREPKEEWVAQVNVTHLIVVEGLGLDPFRKLQITAMCRDFSKLEALRYQDYPEAEILNLAVPLWPLDKARAYLRERVLLHQAARRVLPECTGPERWAKPDIYAVKKAGRQKAVNGGLYTEREEAERHAARAADLSVEFRPGTSDRCRFYCDARQVCTQGQALVGDQAGAE